MYRWLMLMTTLIAATLVAERSSHASIVLPGISSADIASYRAQPLKPIELDSEIDAPEHAVTTPSSPVPSSSAPVNSISDNGVGGVGQVYSLIMIPAPSRSGQIWIRTFVRLPIPPTVELLRPPQA